jgi:AraC-like DNA-binding protein
MEQSPSESHPAARRFAFAAAEARIVDTGRWTMPRGWDSTARSQVHYEVGLVTAGSTRWQSDQRHLRTAPGTAYLVQPGAYSRSRVPADARLPVEGWKITFEWSLLKPRRTGEADAAELAVPELVRLPRESQRELTAAFEAIMRLFVSAPPGWERIATGHLLVILGTLASAGHGGAGAPRVVDRRLAESVAFMTRRLDQPFKIAAAARAAGLTEDYFRRRFHDAFGVGPLAYLQELRLAAARRALVEDPATRVGEAGRAAGFGDERHFARLFRARYGVSPSELRRRLLRARS